jgi:carbamoyltransferase
LNLGGERFGNDNLLKKTAQLIADQQVFGWFHGRMEFGPHSLGARSILADPRNPENYSHINLKIKFRESFRPFAPTVVLERMKDYFEFDQPSPYMLFVA